MAAKTEKKIKTAVKKTAAEKPTAKSKSAAPVKKAAKAVAVKKAPAKKTAAKPAGKVTVKKVAVKSVEKSAAAKKAPAKKTVAKPAGKTAAKKTPVKKAVADNVKKPTKKVMAAKTSAPGKTVHAAAKAVAGRKAKKPVPRVRASALVIPAIPRPIATPVHAGESAEPRRSVHKKLRLTKTQQKHYTALLISERKRFMSQLQFHRADVLSAKKDSAGERAGMATHMADLGSDNFRHDMELTLLSEEGDVVQMIDEALQKIQDSEYGICVECGCAINPERLEAKPYARFCVRCKDKHEKLEDPSRRHR